MNDIIILKQWFAILAACEGTTITVQLNDDGVHVSDGDNFLGSFQDINSLDLFISGYQAGKGIK